MTLTTVVELLAVKLSLPTCIITTKICLDWDSNIQLYICEANGLTDYAYTAANKSSITFDTFNDMSLKMDISVHDVIKRANCEICKILKITIFLL